MGRPPKVRTLENRVAQNLAQAATWLGIPKAALAWARNEGAPGFHGSRVYLAELSPWWEANKVRMADDNGLPSKDILDRLLKKQKLDRERFEDERDRGRFIEANAIGQALFHTGQQMKQLLLSSIVDELPRAAKGLGEIELRLACESRISDIIKVFRDNIGRWIVEPPQPQAMPVASLEQERLLAVADGIALAANSASFVVSTCRRGVHARDALLADPGTSEATKNALAALCPPQPKN
jgi:hypothetical protein